MLPMCLLLGAAFVAFCAAGLFGRAPGVSGEAKWSPVPDGVGEPVRFVGATGCAAAACHGGPATGSLSGKLNSRSWSGAATHCLASDPHTKSYEALEGPLAGAIMSRLHSGAKATEDVRCLACHTNPPLAQPEVSPRERVLQKEGVSCEACHGSASKWLHEHTTWTAAGRPSGYDRSGMTKLYDLGERALACAGCHVGAPADPARGYPVRDMNHDMIAAGHPRLNFDFADYQRRLRPHWFERDRATGTPVGPDFEVKAWLVGRLAHAEAAVLLRADREDRAKNNDPRTPGPEFADWSCVSCHHNLGEKFPPLGSILGKPSIQMIWPLTDKDTAPAAEAAFARFGLSAWVPGPSTVVFRNARAKIVAAPDREAANAVDQLLKSTPRVNFDRDRACQVYHALAARERSRMKREGRTTYDASFDRLAKSLTLQRSNLDFTLKKEILDELKLLVRTVE